MKHYSLKNILQHNALYNVIFVERYYGRRMSKRKGTARKLKKGN